MSGKYKIGDIVQLKSGGPKMTVTILHTLTNITYTTAWFDGSNMQTNSFPEDALMLFTAEDVK